ncbi:hypothetical protein BJX76DRAFT_368978 [Aspergillus varians]
MSTQFSTYSDASSSYWPPGWNFARFASATPADNVALSDEERAKMQAGFRDVLGEYGVAEMARVVWQEQLRVMEAEKEAKREKEDGLKQPVPPPPNWLRAWRRRYQGQGGSWGFVGFLIGTGAGSGAAAEQFQERVQEIVEIPFEAALKQGQSAEEIGEARRGFETRWVRVDEEEEPRAEDGHIDLLERLRARYRSMQESGTLPNGLSLPIFLVASSSATVSVLSTSGAGEKPGTTSSHWRSGAPFLLAVALEKEQGVVDDDEEIDKLVGRGREKDWFKPVFRVAVEVLVDELWPVVEDQITSLGRMTRFVQRAEVTEDVLPVAGDDDNKDGLDAIWWSMHTPPHQMRKRRSLCTT